MSEDTTWPDAGARTKRRAVLHERLDSFLDDFIDDGGQGGYADATPAHVRALQKITQEIIDLKFQRDEDGDQVVFAHFENRQFERMIDVMLPHEPEGGADELTLAKWQSESLYAIARLSSAAASEADSLNWGFKKRVRKLEDDQFYADKLAEMKVAADNGDKVAVTAIMLSVQSRIKDRSLLDFERLYGEVAADDLTDHKAKINAALDTYEASSATDRSHGPVLAALFGAAKEHFGRTALHAESRRWDTIATIKRQQRKAAIV